MRPSSGGGYVMAEHRQALPPARHEGRDVDVRLLTFGLAGTLAVLLMGSLLVGWIYPGIAVDQRLRGPVPHYPDPHLQTDPAGDLRRFIAGELAELNSSGWIDQAHGIAHIPIDAAMRRIAHDGIADWPAPQERAP
jgi:hypothetical protein